MTTPNKIEALFPASLFGCIIGTKGATITTIRNDNGVTITNDKTQGVLKNGCRMITIEGNWISMWNALCDINRAIENGGKDSVSGYDPNDPENNKITCQIKIPGFAAGPFIGKQGSKLKEIRDKHPDVSIDVDRDDAMPDWRFVKIRAVPFMICETFLSIADSLESILAKGQQNNNFNQDISNMSNQNNMLTDPTMGNNDMVLVGGQNLSMNQNSNQNRNRNRDDNRKRDHDDHDGKRRHHRSRDRDDRRNSNRDEYRSSDNHKDQNSTGPMPSGFGDCSATILVHESIIGKIIGAGGNVIKNLRMASGCEIRTDGKGERTDGQREITVKGLVPQVQVALIMLTSHVTMNTPSVMSN